MSLHKVLTERLNYAITAEAATPLTTRDAQLSRIAGKAHAVIGMRRAGKTSFLRQLLAQRRATVPPHQAIYLSFDDDRLAEVGGEQLSLLLEEYYRRFPDLRGRTKVSWLLDEIQMVSGWERFVRRVLDTEKMEIIVSGSSARMLSREVHTSLRGRAMETIIRPFSFREFLRHRGQEPTRPVREFTSADRSRLEKRFLEFLLEGGFPEAQGLDLMLRVELLQGYVDTVLFRDIVERHGVTQVAALRWITRQCLRNPAASFSVHRLHQDLKAQGHGVAKDAVHAMVGHLADAFLITTVPVSTESERRRNSNPRKVYPIDPGMIGAFDRTGRANLGHALETVVLHELERRKAEVGYVKTEGGLEVDFHARFPGGGEELIQVCADLGVPDVQDRELRSLAAAAKEHPRARRRVLVLLREQVPVRVDASVVVEPVYQWLLDG